VDIERTIQLLHFALIPATFFFCMLKRIEPRFTFRPLSAVLHAGVVGMVGVSLNAIGFQLEQVPRAGLIEMLTLQEHTIWHGTTLLSAAYGLMAYSLFRLVFPEEVSE